MHNNKLKNNIHLNNLLKYHKHKSPYKIMFKIIPLKIKFINSIMESEILLQKGRIVYINYGKESEKYAVLVDFVNIKKAIIDSPNGKV